MSWTDVDGALWTQTEGFPPVRHDREFDRVIEAYASYNRRRREAPRVKSAAERRAELAAGAPKTLHEKAVERRKKAKRGGKR